MRALAFTLSFILAFLLFAVQPMATRMVLPTLGGTPAVWNTVMFTFQLLLLAGYGYAHLLTHYFSTRWQLRIHAALIGAAFLFLPLFVALTTSDALIANPIPLLVGAFLMQLGLPFFCLAATAPLLQSWVSRSAHPLSKTPYVLYSASNFGSFAGLLGYVGVVEPLLDLRQQSEGWSLLFASGMAVLLLTGILLKPRDQAAPTANETAAPVAWRERGIWIGLAFLASSLSLGVTTYITTDIASIPLLWVIPLSLYLLSFVDAFRTRPMLVPLFQRTAPILGLTALMIYGFGGHGFTLSYLLQLLAFAALAFALHGWLAARLPAAQHLTQFYLCLSVGGALGGVLNGLVAPLVFREAFEYPIVLLLASVVTFMFLQQREDKSLLPKRQLRMLGETFAVVVALTVLLYLVKTPLSEPLNSQTLLNAAGIGGIVSLIIYRRYSRAFFSCVSVGVLLLCAISNGIVGFKTLYKDRNFFGVARVYEDAKTNARYFMHDTTVHGVQSLDPVLARTPKSYYGALREVFDAMPVTHRHPMAVVGLGIGTSKCLATKGQHVDLFEINLMAKELAENPAFFTYLRDCAGDYTIAMGDGRIQLAAQPDGRYGIIILDAFSSDSIPSHLLTREALEGYLRKLAPHGLLAFNTTNRHIDLKPLLAAQCRVLGCVAYEKFFESPKTDPLLMSAHWVVVAADKAALAPLLKSAKGWNMLVDEGNRPWTDQYTNMLPYFKILRSPAPQAH